MLLFKLYLDRLFPPVGGQSPSGTALFMQTQDRSPEFRPTRIEAIDFLNENRSRILALWERRLASIAPLRLPVVEDRRKLLARIFDHLLRELRGEAHTCKDVFRNILAAVSHSAIGPAHQLFPGFVHFFFGCTADLQELIVEQSTAEDQYTGNTEALAREIETACTVVLHREGHAFAEECGRMLSGNAPAQRLAMPPWLSEAV